MLSSIHINNLSTDLIGVTPFILKLRNARAVDCSASPGGESISLRLNGNSRGTGVFQNNCEFNVRYQCLKPIGRMAWCITQPTPMNSAK